jgi:uncharacterized Zn finger protein (UPF0148 family)
MLFVAGNTVTFSRPAGKFENSASFTREVNALNEAGFDAIDGKISCAGNSEGSVRDTPSAKRIRDLQEEMTRMKFEQNKFLVNIRLTEDAILRKAEEIKKQVDISVSQITVQLRSFEARTSIDIKSKIDKLEALIKELENIQASSEQSKLSGEMNVRTNKLLESYVPNDNYKLPDLVFTPNDWNDRDSFAIGRLVSGKQTHRY